MLCPTALSAARRRGTGVRTTIPLSIQRADRKKDSCLAGLPTVDGYFCEDR
jgi:hypothetical protein